MLVRTERAVPRHLQNDVSKPLTAHKHAPRDALPITPTAVRDWSHKRLRRPGNYDGGEVVPDELVTELLSLLQDKLIPLRAAWWKI